MSEMRLGPRRSSTCETKLEEGKVLVCLEAALGARRWGLALGPPFTWTAWSGDRGPGSPALGDGPGNEHERPSTGTTH